VSGLTPGPHPSGGGRRDRFGPIWFPAAVALFATAAALLVIDVLVA